MSGLLADLYSAGDRMKRKLGGLLSNPLETIALGSQRMAEDTNALARLASEAGYMPNTVNRSDQSVLVSERQKALARALLADKATEMGANMVGATVWHGSPHKFDKFDSSKIGTGEGAQAYGHGLYLAESPDVAKSYQTSLSAERGFSFDGKTGLTRAQVEDMANAKYGSGYLDGVIRPSGVAGSFIDDMVTGVNRAEGFYPRQYKPGSERAKLYDELRGKITHADPGSLYKVDLPDNAIARMLDWDRPLSQQAPEVSNALKSLIGDVTGGGFDLSRAPRNLRNAFSTSGIESAEQALAAKYGAKKTSTGWVDKSGRPIAQDAVDKMLAKFGGRGYENAGQLYNDLAHVAGSQADISAALRNNGIPGIRYLDGGSRGAGQGTSNFVIFPGQEDILTILERNGVPIK